jgi:hypothetical protein
MLPRTSLQSLPLCALEGGVTYVIRKFVSLAQLSSHPALGHEPFQKALKSELGTQQALC